MIEKGLGIPRREVYICNIVKCRPPGNRTPLADEVASCRPFLDAQIDAVQPRVIVALGKPAASLLLGRDVAITRARGTLARLPRHPGDAHLPSRVRAAPVHGGEPAPGLERPEGRARAQSSASALSARAASQRRAKFTQ